MLKKSFKKTCLGIDIGTHAIKILEAGLEQDKNKISKLFIKSLPPSSLPETLLDTMRSLLENADFSTKDVHISLSGPNATVRFITMPQMSQQDLKNALKFEADKYIPYSTEEVVMDSSILSKAQEEKGQMRVLLAAAKKEIINERIGLFKQMGCNVKVIDIDSFAIFNAFLKAVKDIDKEKSIALLNLGHRFTNVVIFKGGNPYFTRDIQIGGEEIDKAIGKQFNVDEAEANKLKIDPGDKAAEIQELTKGILNNLTDEIRLSFGYYENQYGRSIDQIYISGGLTGIKDIAPSLEEGLGLSGHFWDPLSDFVIENGVNKDELDKARSSLAVASGLVLR